MFKDLLFSTSKIESTRLKVVGTIYGLFGTAFIFYFSQIVPVILIANIFALSGNDNISQLFSDNLLVQFMIIFIVSVTSVILIFKILKRLRKKPVDFLLLKNRLNLNNALDVIITYAAYFIVFIVVSIVVSSLTSINVDQAQDLGINHPESTLRLGVVFLMLVVIPPITEEIMFRGFLFRILNRFSGKIIAYILTSILFGLAHLEYGNLNWIAVLDTLIFSVFLIYISQKHQSLYSAMLLHAIKNSIAFYVLFVL